MARNKNRRKDEAGSVFPRPLAIILGVAVVLALGFLWLKGRCDDLGRQIKQLEAKKEDLQRRVVNEEYKLSNMLSPQNMEALLKTHNLNMTWPSQKAIVRIYRPAPRADGTSLYAQSASSERHD